MPPQDRPSPWPRIPALREATRRRTLAAIGATLTGLAGCTSQSSDQEPEHASDSPPVDDGGQNGSDHSDAEYTEQERDMLEAAEGVEYSEAWDRGEISWLEGMNGFLTEPRVSEGEVTRDAAEEIVESYHGEYTAEDFSDHLGIETGELMIDVAEQTKTPDNAASMLTDDFGIAVTQELHEQGIDRNLFVTSIRNEKVGGEDRGHDAFMVIGEDGIYGAPSTPEHEEVPIDETTELPGNYYKFDAWWPDRVRDDGEMWAINYRLANIPLLQEERGKQGIRTHNRLQLSRKKVYTNPEVWSEYQELLDDNEDYSSEVMFDLIPALHMMEYAHLKSGLEEDHGLRLNATPEELTEDLAIEDYVEEPEAQINTLSDLRNYNVNEREFMKTAL